MTKAGTKRPSVQRARALAAVRSSSSRACFDVSGPSGLRRARKLTGIRKAKADRLIVNVPHRKSDEVAEAKMAMTKRKNTAKTMEAKRARNDRARGARSESACRS